MSEKKYILDIGDSAAKRLTILNNAYGPCSAGFLKEIGIKPGMHVLDLGCGTGEMTLWFAKEVGSAGSVTGIDFKEQVEVAKKRVEQAGFHNTNFQALNIMDAASLQQQFDLVYCRFVLAFLTSAKQGLQIMYQLAKPGGLIACEEIECSSWTGYPHSAAYDKHVELFMKLGQSKGMDFNTGPKLYNDFRELGLPPYYVKIAEPVFLGPEQKQHMVLVTQECAQGYLDAGLATTAELDKLIVELKKLTQDESFLMAGARVFQVAARKL